MTLRHRWIHADIIGRMPSSAANTTDSRLAARLAAFASFGAASIHFAAAPTHWQEWMPAGQFFVILALLQLIWSAAVFVRPAASLLVAGVMLNIGVIALWAVSRTAGAPFGPHAGQPEAVQGADLFALLLEIYIVMGAGWVLYRGRDEQPIPTVVNAIVLLGIGAVVAAASTLGVASGLRHSHHGPVGAESDHHGPVVESVDDHHRQAVGDVVAPHGHPPISVPAPPADSIGTPAVPAAPLVEAPSVVVVPSDDGHGDHPH